MKRMMVFARRNAKEILRDPISMCFGIIFPVVLLALLSLINNAIPEEGNVTVAQKGDFFVVADGAVSIGAKVYANTTTGAVTFTSGEGAVDTGYVAMTAAAATGELVIISNW